MKNKILFALLVLVVAFSLVGCGPRVYTVQDFVGKWKEHLSHEAFSTAEYYVLTEDGLWESWYYSDWSSSSLSQKGTWVHNGDNTVTLTYGLTFGGTKEMLATLLNEFDEEANKSYTYLLINDVKYYEVEDED